MGNVIMVKNGVAHGDEGKIYAKVTVPDGYYIDKYILANLTSNGEWKGKPLDEIGDLLPGPGLKATTISEYPQLITDDGEQTNFMRIEPKLPIGSAMLIWGYRYNHYFYIMSTDGQDSIIQKLSLWWRKYPVEEVWVLDGNKRPVINPAYEAWTIKEFGKEVWAIVGRHYNDYAGAPSELQAIVGKDLRRSLGRVRRGINEYLKQIGGEVLELSPFWAKGVALIGIRFRINGVDPLHGNWAYMYKDSKFNFYYGPWCERLRQKDVEGGSVFLHSYPPKYTLNDWITGPLFATAINARDKVNPGDIPPHPPTFFQPTGTRVLAMGTAYSRGSDGVGDVDNERTAKEIGNLIKEYFNPVRGVGAFEEYIQIKFSAAIRKAKLNEDKGTHEPYARVPFEGWIDHRGVSEYILTDMKTHRIHVNLEGDQIGHDLFRDNNISVECVITADWKWGFDGTEPDMNPEFFAYASHFQLVVKGCGCPNCRNARLGAAHAIMDLQESISIAPEATRKAVETGDAGRYNLWRYNAVQP